MSEAMPEGGASGAVGGGFMTKKFFGIPAIVWILGAVLIAYMVFRKSSSGTSGGATSSGGGGSATTGNIRIQPGTTTIDVSGQYGPFTQNTSNSQNNTKTNHHPPRHRTPNPQPRPHPKPPVQHHQTTVKTPGYVTVGKWPGKSSGGRAQWNTTVWGIANHFGTSVAQILKLNPQIKNESLVYPGERVRYK